jgi:hypothetical protein
LLDRLGVDSLFQRSDCQPFHVDDDPSHVEFCGGRRFTLGFAASAQAERRWGTIATWCSRACAMARAR